MANVQQTFNVRCESYSSTISGRIYDYLMRGSLGDCFLSAEGKFIRAHKLILSTASEYFETIFGMTGFSDKPIIIMPREVKFSDLCLILDFAYLGQAQVPNDRLDEFLRAGELLQIRGIIEGRIRFMNQQQQQVSLNLSFDATISSSTSQDSIMVPAPKKSRDDDEISIQEASEIMKMLCADNIELIDQTPVAETQPEKEEDSNSDNSNPLPQDPRVVNYIVRPPVGMKCPRKSKGIEKKFECQFCKRSITTKGRVLKHERECKDNPNRVVATCDICHATMMPSSLTHHKNSKHGPKTTKPFSSPVEVKEQFTTTQVPDQSIGEKKIIFCETSSTVSSPPVKLSPSKVQSPVSILSNEIIQQ